MSASAYDLVRQAGSSACLIHVAHMPNRSKINENAPSELRTYNCSFRSEIA
jgi:hypothetical protein